MTLFLPCLIMVALMFMFVWGAEDSIQLRIAVFQEQSEPLAEVITERISRLPGHSVERLSSRDEDFKSLLLSDRFDLIIHYPSRLADSIISGERPVVELKTMKVHTSVWVRQEIDQIMQMGTALAAGRSMTETDLINELRQVDTGYYTVKRSGSVHSQLPDRVIGFLLLFLFAEAMGITRLLLKEKENRTYFRIQAAPVPGVLYTLANFLSALLVLMIQVGITLAAAVAAFRIDFGVSVSHLLMLLWAYSFCVVGFGLLLTGMVNSAGKAGYLAIFIMTPACMLGGCYWPVTFMPTFMQKLAWITPQYWTMTGLTALRRGFSAAGLNLIILAAMGCLFISLYWLLISRPKTSLAAA